MATEQRRECWFCFTRLMERAPDLGWGWYKCSNCGATHVDIPTPIGAPMSLTTHQFEGYTRTAWKPNPWKAKATK